MPRMLRERAALVALAIAVTISMVWLLRLDSQLTFIADDWMLLVKRHAWSFDYFLHPFHGSIVLGPGVVYKFLQETVGIGSATPYYFVALATFALSAVLLFFYLRRRVGDWLALFGAVLILFLGAAFEDLLFAFQVGYFGSVAAGIGMLLCLDREDEKWDRVACGLLAISLAFGSVGIAFAAGAVVDFVLGRRPRGRRFYLAFGPIVLFGIWWLGWGHEAESHVSLDNILNTPEFAFNAASAGFVSLFGLATGDGSEPDQPHLIWGKLLLIAGALLLLARTVRRGGISRGLGVALAIGFTFWIITGVNRNETRLPTSSRYQYPSAIFLLLIVGEGLRGLRPPRLAIVAAAVATALSIQGGISLIEREHEERWVPSADSLRATLGAIEVAGPAANPDFKVFFPPDVYAPAGDYLRVVDRFGSPAFTEAEIEEHPHANLPVADVALAQALGLALESPQSRSLRCQRLDATGDGTTGLTLFPGTFSFENLGPIPIELLLSRFSNELSVTMGTLEPQVPSGLEIPRDNSQRPWVLGLKGLGSVELCVADRRLERSANRNT
jgi:hypothetical protein